MRIIQPPFQAYADQDYSVDRTLMREPRLWVPGKKPASNVQVDRIHPLASGLKFCVSHGAQNMPPDLVTGVVPDFDASFIPRAVPNPYTGNISMYSSGSNLFYDHQGAWDSLHKDITIFTIVVLGVAARFHCLVSKGLGNCANNSEFDFYADNGASGSISLFLNRADGSQYNIHTPNSAPGLSINTPYAIAVSADTDLDATNYEWMINGVSYSDSLSSGSSTGSPASTTYPIRLGQRDDSTPDLYGWQDIICVWNRRLSIEEMHSMTQDPYQFLIPA